MLILGIKECPLTVLIKESRLIDCCKQYLIFAGVMEFHEWDEVFNAEVTTLRLEMYSCEFCRQSYYLAK